jgi:hypothetical protein
MMAMHDENHFQPVIDRFEDDVLTLAYYINDRDVICGEYKFAKNILKLYGVHVPILNLFRTPKNFD